jgi:hypothetical protein
MHPPELAIQKDVLQLQGQERISYRVAFPTL